MKEIVYDFDRRGGYLSDEAAVFGEQTHLRLIIKPHEFELKLSGEVLRSSSCKGYIIETSSNAEVNFYDANAEFIAKSAGVDRSFSQVEFSMKENLLRLSFGRFVTVDNYPNCDGEYDRWSTEWSSEYEVIFDTFNCRVTVAF